MPIDPERDTPVVLAEHVSAVHPRIVGLTGTPDQVRDVACAYEVFYAKAETEGADDGSTD